MKRADLYEDLSLQELGTSQVAGTGSLKKHTMGITGQCAVGAETLLQTDQNVMNAGVQSISSKPAHIEEAERYHRTRSDDG